MQRNQGVVLFAQNSYNKAYHFLLTYEMQKKEFIRIFGNASRPFPGEIYSD